MLTDCILLYSTGNEPLAAVPVPPAPTDTFTDVQSHVPAREAAVATPARSIK